MKRICKISCGDGGGGVFGGISFRTKVWASLPSGCSSNVFERASLLRLPPAHPSRDLWRRLTEWTAHPTHTHTLPPPHPLAQGTAAFPANPLPGAGSPRSPAHESWGLLPNLISHSICKVSLQNLFCMWSSCAFLPPECWHAFSSGFS